MMNKPSDSNRCARIFSNIFWCRRSTAATAAQHCPRCYCFCFFFGLYLSRILSLPIGHLSRREKVQKQKRLLDEAAKHIHVAHCSGSSCQHKVRCLIKLHLWDEGLQWRSAVWVATACAIEKRQIKSLQRNGTLSHRRSTLISQLKPTEENCLFWSNTQHKLVINTELIWSRNKFRYTEQSGISVQAECSA